MHHLSMREFWPPEKEVGKGITPVHTSEGTWLQMCMCAHWGERGSRTETNRIAQDSGSILEQAVPAGPSKVKQK